MSTPELIEHFFRHEYGGLVAILSRRVGVQHIEAVEDAVQSALMKALDAWLPAVNKILYLLFTEGYLGVCRIGLVSLSNVDNIRPL